jgi:hypothetical protein
MKRPTYDLLTVDEAQDLVGRAAIALADALCDRPDRLQSLLTGKGTLRGLPLDARSAAHSWRGAVAHVHAVGLEWVLEDQIEGALSYGGLEIERLVSRAA